MCFNRRRNIFTLGDFQNTTNPIVARVRAQIKNRQPSDVFERDPFKVQSFNFRYAERPSSPGTASHSQASPPHCQSRHTKFDSKPFETYFYNHGFNFARHDENDSQASESTSLRGRKYEELQAAASTSANLSYKPAHRSHYPAAAHGHQADSQRQQWAHKYATAAGHEPRNPNEQKLSAYLERRSAARSNKFTNTSATSVSVQQRGAQERLPPWLCRNEERVSPADAAARARQAARGSSKAMAAAVGTIGKVPSTTSGHECPSSQAAAANATARRLSSGSVGSGFAPPLPNRHNVGSWRSCPTPEYQRSYRGSCSTSMLAKKGSLHGAPQAQPRQQHGPRPGELQQWRLVPPTVEAVVSRNKPGSSRTVVQRCNSCEISINIKPTQPKQAKTENVVIKIESASPFRVVSNAGCGSGTTSGSNMRSKRLNDLMSRRTTANVTPRGLNIMPKASSGTVEMNKWQSKHSLSSASGNSVNQRVLNCERFVEREGERLRQRTGSSVACVRKASDVGKVLGTASSQNRVPGRSVPWVKSNVVGQPPAGLPASASTSSRAVPLARTATNVSAEAVAAMRLKNMCDRQMMSLHQLRASIDAISTAANSTKPAGPMRAPAQTLKRSSTAPERLNALSKSDRLSRQCSTSTFTLPSKSSFNRNGRSISPASYRSDSSYRSRNSNSSFWN